MSGIALKSIDPADVAVPASGKSTLFMDSTAGDAPAYKKSDGSHTSMIGPIGVPGIDGTVWRDGTGVPSNSLGVDGDYYLDAATGDVYLKTGGSYSIVANIKGADGIVGVDGNTILYGAVDPTSEGIDGNFYINTATHFFFGPKNSGVWPAGTSLVGPTGAPGADGGVGSVGPPGPAPTGTGYAHVVSSVLDAAGVAITYQIEVMVGDGVNPILTGLYPTAVISLPRNGTLVSWTVLSCDAATPTTGAIVFDLWKNTYVNYPPTIADSMCGSGTKPNITATNSKGTGTDFANWTTTTFTAGDALFVNVDSITSLKAAKLILTYTDNGT